jgi:hypothetical protein
LVYLFTTFLIKINFLSIFQVDFGIARRFLDNNGAILTPRQKTKFKGTVRFAPIATHNQEELGRKDDCESWLYMIADMIKAERLPWHDLDDRKEVEKMKKRAMEDPTRLFNEKVGEIFAFVNLFLNFNFSGSGAPADLRISSRTTLRGQFGLRLDAQYGQKSGEEMQLHAGTTLRLEQQDKQELSQRQIPEMKM